MAPATKITESNGSRPTSPNASKIVKTNGVNDTKPTLARTTTDASASSTTSAGSAFSASGSSVGSDASSATSVGGSAYSESTTKVDVKQTTKVMKTALAEACFDLRFERGLLWGKCIQWNDAQTREDRSFPINEYIANIDGKLVWDGKDRKNFMASCKNIKIKDGYILVAECRRQNSDVYVISEFDLRTKIRIDRGNFVEIIFDNKLTKMLTEVPWMKFKVIAEPDLSVFAGHPIVKETMIKIAQSTVQHVTMEMSVRLQRALQVAISEVTMSAISYINTELDLVVQETSGIGAAQVHPSCTNGQYLHEMGSQDLAPFKEVLY